MLVAGRALQGLAMGLVPVAMAAARDHMPTERVPGTIALLSVSAAAGVGAGYPISGLFASALGLSAAFWFGAAMAGLTLLAAFFIVPASSSRTRTSLDATGVVLLTAGLTALLIAVAQGSSWGWASPVVLALLAGSAIVMSAWVAQQLRVRDPLVELRLLRRPAVAASDCFAFVLGIAMYMFLSVISEFVQVPSELGYGFSASVVVAGLCLVPFSVISIVVTRVLPSLREFFGERALLPIGSILLASAGAFFAVFHQSIAAAFAAMGILGFGFGLTYALIPGRIVRSVPESETGSAMGFYQVVRYIGFSLGSALAASILASDTPPGQHQPLEGGYTLALWVAVGFCLAAAVMAWVLPTEAAHPTEGENVLGEEDAELASAGLVGVTRD